MLGDLYQKPVSIESVLEELTISGSDVSVIVNTRFWNAIPLLIREWDGKNEATMMRLLNELLRILTLASDSEVAMANKRLLHSSLSALSLNPTLPKKGRLRITQSLSALDSLPDGPFVLVETDEFRSMEEQNKDLREQVARIEEEMKKVATDLVKLKHKLKDLPIWVGTESLQTFDCTRIRLTPTALIQINKARIGSFDQQTSFTFPIYEGEWELKIRASDHIFRNGILGFQEFPLPEDATENTSGSYPDGIGGDFELWLGGMWKAGKEFKPEGTNKKCDRVGQTAAIRVNMRTRQDRLWPINTEQDASNHQFTTHLSNLFLSLTQPLPDMFTKFTHHTPLNSLPSLVIAQLGCTQHRVRFGSDLAALRKDSAHMPRK
ncbi:hypothetical protein BLNAU_7128 [Blattamonas nauphoetae]|uniref:Uncharacterized protein n=1 Tax=Blattamonas nauphoetae TaxID=2049346 RepID=A0ABQ9Y2H3_9EUKA|nr:hypothetical protein BLNAU_7128 [Blattamonas nauphoetae]